MIQTSILVGGALDALLFLASTYGLLVAAYLEFNSYLITLRLTAVKTAGVNGYVERMSKLEQANFVSRSTSNRLFFEDFNLTSYAAIYTAIARSYKAKFFGLSLCNEPK